MRGSVNLYQIKVRMKKLGKKTRAAIEAVTIELAKKPETVRELIAELTKSGVEAYNERKEDGELLKHLTKQEIEDKASSGKISFDARGGNDADADKAIENALQCFEDGIIRIFANETELEELEQRILCDENTVFTFVRLTMLAGW